MQAILYLLCFLFFEKSVLSDNGNMLGNILDVSWRLPEPQGSPNTLCERDIQSMYTSLRNMTLWAYEMWDASARAPSGLLQGNQGHYGNWDECVGEDRPSDGSYGMPRQYCTVTTYLVPFPPTEYSGKVHPLESAYNQLYTAENNFVQNGSLAYWGLCVPASCNHTELSTLLQDHFRNESLRIHMATQNQESIPGSNDTIRHQVQAQITSSSQCHKPEGENFTLFKPGIISFLVICGLSLVAVTVATCYDWWTRHKPDSDGKCPRLVRALSLIVNMKKLGQQGEAGELRILNGLRVISILLIMMFHHTKFTFFVSVVNWNYVEKLSSTLEWVLLTNGDLMVDNFFVMSGILICYKLLKVKPGSSLNYPHLIFDRYIRLIPVYIMVIMYTANILPLMGSGPYWANLIMPEVQYCRTNWWTNILMINNYVNTGEMCIEASWFIPCEFHFFLLSLSVLWLLRSRPRLGLFYLAALILASILIPALIGYNWFSQVDTSSLKVNLHDPVSHLNNSFKLQIYMPSHNRAGPYLIGLLTGYLLVKYEKSVNKVVSMKTSILTTLIALTVIFITIFTRVYSSSATSASPELVATYLGLQRPLWALAVCAIIICCTLGQVPLVTSFLGWSPWAPLARLVYGVYLTHMDVQLRSFGNYKTPYHFSRIMLFGEMAGVVFYSLLASFLMHLFIEAPCRGIINILTSTSHKKRKCVQNGHTQNPVVEEVNIQ